MCRVSTIIELSLLRWAGSRKKLVIDRVRVAVSVVWLVVIGHLHVGDADSRTWLQANLWFCLAVFFYMQARGLTYELFCG